VPEGFEGVREAAAEIEERKAAGGKSFDRKLQIEDGGSAIVRFLEQGKGVKWCWAHQVPAIGKQKWGDWLPCLDQRGKGEKACPACEAGGELGKRKFQGYINVIWHDAPKFPKDDQGRDDWAKGPLKNSDGSVVVEPTIAKWNKGITVFEELDGIDATFGGLTTRLFKVTRRGTSTSSRYTILPAAPDAGPQPMSDIETQLAATKYDLSLDVTPLSYDKMAARCRGERGGDSDTVQASNGTEAVDVNPFLS
jgi:hypothetical protein